MTFDVAKVNAKGQEVERKKAEASYFAQDLGNGITLEMIAILGGTFTMGSPANEKDSFDDERPQHQVTVPPFFMGKYPVTQAQWRAVASRTDLKVEKDLDPDPSYFKDPPKPPLKRGRVVSFSQMSFNQILIWQGFQSISQNKYLKNF